LAKIIIPRLHGTYCEANIIAYRQKEVNFLSTSSTVSPAYKRQNTAETPHAPPYRFFISCSTAFLLSGGVIGLLQQSLVFSMAPHRRRSQLVQKFASSKLNTTTVIK